MKRAAEWPGVRLVEVWNSFAGVAPFTELKPVFCAGQEPRNCGLPSTGGRGFRVAIMA